MILCRDILAFGAAPAATAAMGGLFILPAVYPPRVPLGYLAGTVAGYDPTTTRYGGMRGTYEVRLERGEVVCAAARDTLVPGDRVCLRATQRRAMIEGFVVAMTHCPAM
jgi:hypothetical protein